jgi:hypothetical protein
VALGGNWWPHYYQQLLPPAAVAIAIAIQQAWPTSRPMGRGRVALQGIALVTVGFLAFSLTTVLARPQALAAIIGYQPSVYAAAPIADYLRAHTDPTERIYVMYHEAGIYYLAERRPAARWLYQYELIFTPGAFDEQVARLADPATAPRYIVGAQPFNANGYDPQWALRSVVTTHYTLETTIGGIPLYRLNP